MFPAVLAAVSYNLLTEEYTVVRVMTVTLSDRTVTHTDNFQIP
jgi:hypothetical protein